MPKNLEKEAMINFFTLPQYFKKIIPQNDFTLLNQSIYTLLLRAWCTAHTHLHYLTTMEKKERTVDPPQEEDTAKYC